MNRLSFNRVYFVFVIANLAPLFEMNVNQETHKYVQANIAHNNRQLQYIRSCFSAISGSAAGILGLQNWNGFLFFALSWMILNGMILTIKARKEHFINMKALFLDGAIGGLLSFLLFHTLLYGLVYLYQ
ncbi:unnamed protein product [Rhizopus microsporus]